MKVLLDTQAILQAAQGTLSSACEKTLSVPTTEIYYSPASFWEIGIKTARGTLTLKTPLKKFAEQIETELGAICIPLEIEAIEKATSLPFYHKDPFDRILAGVALTARMPIVSGDKIFEKYNCKRIW